jgi:hypothetical protein
MKSPAKEVPPADRVATSAYQPSGSGGRTPCRLIWVCRSRSIASPVSPPTPRRLRREATTTTIATPTRSSPSVIHRRPGIVSCWKSRNSSHVVAARTTTRKAPNRGTERGESHMSLRSSGMKSVAAVTTPEKAIISADATRVMTVRTSSRPWSRSPSQRRRSPGDLSITEADPEVRPWREFDTDRP